MKQVKWTKMHENCSNNQTKNWLLKRVQYCFLMISIRSFNDYKNEFKEFMLIKFQ